MNLNEKVLNTWKHIVTHDKGQLSKEMRELILETINLLEELKKIKEQVKL